VANIIGAKLGKSQMVCGCVLALIEPISFFCRKKIKARAGIASKIKTH